MFIRPPKVHHQECIIKTLIIGPFSLPLLLCTSKCIRSQHLGILMSFLFLITKIAPTVFGLTYGSSSRILPTFGSNIFIIHSKSLRENKCFKSNNSCLPLQSPSPSLARCSPVCERCTRNMKYVMHVLFILSS